MNLRKRLTALLLVMSLIVVLLSGCSSGTINEAKSTETVTVENTPEVSVASSNDVNESEQVNSDSSDAIEGLSDEQKNSLNMLNYLAFLTQEILSKKNNRVYIEQVYTSLINDINPSTVNDLTEAHYDDLLDRLHEFEKLLTKRERLQYLFEQNQAQAMRNAIPNPIGLLSAVSSMNIASLVSSVAYMAVDSISSYASGMSAAEQTFLQDTWQLDDEESDTIHSLRKQTFMYMVEVVKGFTLPDKLTLTEKKVDKLVEWNEKDKDEVSAASRVLFYKTYESEYEGFGQYWLARAVAHYDNNEYEDCLKSIQRYRNLQIGIYRQDYELAKVLPIAVAAASQIYDDKTYVEAAEDYVDQILINTDIKKDWALRYFAAQTYIDLCARTQDKSYLQKAYTIALENSNELKAEQKRLNSEYLAELILEEIPKGTSDERKKEIEAYNKQKQIERELELPPVYEPLKLNLDLLYALAEQLAFDDSDMNNMEDVLYVDGKSLFLSAPMNARYKKGTIEKPHIKYTGKDITIPAIYLIDDAKVTVQIREEADTVIIDDWTLTKVDRKNKADVSSFITTFHSKTAESYDFKKALDLTIEVKCFGTSEDQIYAYSYKVKNSKEWVFFDKAEFEEIE